MLLHHIQISVNYPVSDFLFFFGGIADANIVQGVRMQIFGENIMIYPFCIFDFPYFSFAAVFENFDEKMIVETSEIVSWKSFVHFVASEPNPPKNFLNSPISDQTIIPFRWFQMLFWTKNASNGYVKP